MRLILSQSRRLSKLLQNSQDAWDWQSIYKSRILFLRCTIRCDRKTVNEIMNTNGILPMRYLRVPITANKLSKLEYKILWIKLWQESNITLGFILHGRITLVNSVMFVYLTFGHLSCLALRVDEALISA